MQLEAELTALASALRSRDPVANAAEGPAFAPRVDVYRRLIRDRFISAITATLPRTYALLGASRTIRWVDDFLVVEGVKSPFFREVAGELARFMARANEPFSEREIDIAAFEALRFEVSVSPADEAAQPVPLELTRAVRFSLSARLFSARFAVQHEADDTVPVATYLLLYREEQRAHVLELTAAAYAILGGLCGGDTLAEGIRRGAERSGIALTPAIVTEISSLLTDLGQRGVVLGAL